MLNNLVFIALPYAALALVLLVTPYRWRTNRLTWSAYSTQFLESGTLYWGSVPWHYGIIPVVTAHLLGIVAPGTMKSFFGNQETLIFLESVGLGLGLLALFGSIVLLLRRGNSPMLRKVTFAGDVAVLFLLALQAATGVYIGAFMSWGGQWYLDTAVPYFYSLFTFNPQIEYMADLPLIVKLHAAGAFLIVALLPFTKLVHLLFLPFDFLKDPPILYRWLSRPKDRVG